MSYVCAYSCVQLDKSRVEKEFTQFLSQADQQTPYTTQICLYKAEVEKV